jgi:thiamine monophosphate synthase
LGLTAKLTPVPTPLIVNDHAEVARRVPVEGARGQDDDSIGSHGKAGRAVLVGRSTHSLEQAFSSAREGADYIGWSDFRDADKTRTTRQSDLDIKRALVVSLPIFCIGGINIGNLDK